MGDPTHLVEHTNINMEIDQRTYTNGDIGPMSEERHKRTVFLWCFRLSEQAAAAAAALAAAAKVFIWGVLIYCHRREGDLCMFGQGSEGGKREDASGRMDGCCLGRCWKKIREKERETEKEREGSCTLHE